jgi:hypothetical protein
MVALVKMNIHWTGLGEEGLTGCWFTPGGVSTLAALETAVNNARDEIAAASYKNYLIDIISADQSFDKLTAYYYADATAKASFGASAAFAGTGLVGGSSPNNPLQTAICCTLGTGHTGASYRGRMYLPATGISLVAGHQFDTTQTQNTVTMLAGTGTTDGLLWDMARALDAAGSGGSDPVVFSRKLNQENKVTTISADTRPDIQRRRAKSQVPIARKTSALYEYTG